MRLEVPALFLAVLLPAAAQEFRATLTGRVLDPHGSPVAGATVTTRNTGANFSQQTRSDSHGNYTATFLQPGSYNVTVEATGFRKAIQEDVLLTVGQAATLEFKLEL